MGFRIDLLEREHGVPNDQVVVLRKTFGATLPENVRGPGETIHWALSYLPWTELHPLLRRWFGLAVERGLDLGDFRIRAVMGLLVDEPDPEVAARTMNEVYSVAQTYARMYGEVTQEGIRFDASPNPTVRMWTSAIPVCDAVIGACDGLRGDARMVNATLTAALSLIDQPVEGADPGAVLDTIVRETIAALARYVGTWTRPWKAS